MCGLHTAIGVGIAQVLARMRQRFTGRAMFLFQPAEEMVDGARAMIDISEPNAAGIGERLVAAINNLSTVTQLQPQPQTQRQTPEAEWPPPTCATSPW